VPPAPSSRVLHPAPALPPTRRWSLLSAAGAAAPADTFLATNALYYKYFEYEALGRGVPSRQRRAGGGKAAPKRARARSDDDDGDDDDDEDDNDGEAETDANDDDAGAPV
jgi:hypothetical protein